MRVNDDGSHNRKVPSTPDDPSRAVLEAFEGSRGRDADPWIVHGSTVATNALLERKLARTALVTTLGFADVIEIGRQHRDRLYDLDETRPASLVPSSLRFEIDERTLASGEILRAPSAEQLEALVVAIEAAGVESVAVVLLHSYANPENENAIGEALRRLDLPVSLSSRVLREFREVERLGTTAVNASVAPVMEAYLERLEEGLPPGRLRVMQSNGGSISSRAARRSPVRTVLSGPAGGAVGALRLGEAIGIRDLITFDMGGTSTDVFLARGAPTITTGLEIAGSAVAVPVLDIHTVGAGGGSIARIDAGGALRVGPESAGADPGPVAYGKGEEMTVTDANLVLGRLAPDRLLGGDMKLDIHRVRPVLHDLAGRTGLEPRALARGVIRVVEASMERAIRVISVERGHDPREFALVCFGGAGGLHAVSLAARLGLSPVIVPTAPGVFSAWGMALADVTRDASRTWREWEGIPGVFAEMSTRLVEGLGAEGFAPEQVILERSVDLRYAGQSYELNVPWGDSVAADFHDLHEIRFGYRDQDRDVEPVTLRVRAIGPVEATESVREPEEPATAATAAAGTRTIGFADSDLIATVYTRERLRPGMAFEGPAVVEEYSSTTLVPLGYRARVDGLANLVIERKDAR